MENKNNILESFGCSLSILQYTDYFQTLRIMNSMNKSSRKWWKRKNDLYSKAFQGLRVKKYIRVNKFTKETVKMIIDERYKYLDLSIFIRNESSAQTLLLFWEKFQSPECLKFRQVVFSKEWSLGTWKSVINFLIWMRHSPNITFKMEKFEDNDKSKDNCYIPFLDPFSLPRKCKSGIIKRFKCESKQLVELCKNSNFKILQLVISCYSDLTWDLKKIPKDSNFSKYVERIVMIDMISYRNKRERRSDSDLQNQFLEKFSNWKEFRRIIKRIELASLFYFLITNLESNPIDF